MSISKRVKRYLEENHVPYTHCTHRLAYTAQEVAAAMHVPGKLMAKAIILKADSKFIMLVLPAVLRIDMQELKQVLPYRKVDLATEQEFASLFPDSDVGAMAPFGNLYDIPVYVDRVLAEEQDIVFNAGTHVETIRMKFEDFQALVKPTMVDASVHMHAG